MPSQSCKKTPILTGPNLHQAVISSLLNNNIKSFRKNSVNKNLDLSWRAYMCSSYTISCFCREYRFLPSLKKRLLMIHISRNASNGENSKNCFWTWLSQLIKGVATDGGKLYEKKRPVLYAQYNQLSLCQQPLVLWTPSLYKLNPLKN